ncbi:DHH phosphoesterase [Aspergillus sclerotiicarbonarius CBS 121057]|uniref:DHH phosphoesterase n=1 Tax=Aspergillus sclerotiicarbonarius (strain CBS 121057 / IBT 28362) TaxID=1448318 RepID=A0A319F2T6_ASPSB|nr:DHH phosphoesterase [Aspergillus sclerotiicarbonarius CBS 121057]
MPVEHSLFQFLAKALQTHHRFLAGRLSRAEAPIYVIGNPSADLDSIISAIVYASFAHPRPHVPLINLPSVPAGPELRRLRPEFVKSLWLSTHPPAPDDQTWADTPESAGPLLHDHLLTVADFAAHLQQTPDHPISADAVLVDWNALPIRSPSHPRGQGSLPALPTITFTVLGCIDHHVDESFLAPITDPDQPFLLQPSGSCTSLVVNMLDKMDRWRRTTTPIPNPPERQLAKLAMSPILIDTSNFTAKEKVTDADTLAYSFLRSKINSGPHDDTEKPWDHNAFYEEINTAKRNSLDLLTVEEVLDRDYKQWTESPASNPQKEEVEIGICSMVRSLPWVVQKAGSAEAFLDALGEFATQKELQIVMVMTAFTAGPEGRFCRELLVCAKEGTGVRGVEAFMDRAGAELGLEEWRVLDGEEGAELRDAECADKTLRKWIWVQGDVTKSRKQVAPLIREAVGSL